MRKPKSACRPGEKMSVMVESAATPDEADADLRRLAEVVKFCYVSERSKWESYRSGHVVNYRPALIYDGQEAQCIEGDSDAVVTPAKPNLWLKLARVFKQHDIPVQSYILLQFSLLSPYDNRAPEPPQLHAARYMERWQKYGGKIKERLRNELVIQQDIAAREFTSERSSGSSAENSWAIVLTANRLELSPLFRYAVARHLGGKRFDRIAAYYHDAAVAQLQRNSLYLEVWRKLLPAELLVIASERTEEDGEEADE